MTTRFDAAVGKERGPGAGAEHPSLARAHVSVGIGVSLENAPGGKGLGGEEPSRVEYLWPAITALEERELRGSYEALTGRRVWPRMLPLLRVVHRRHGPDTVALLGELYEKHGVQDLLIRLRDHPPRLDTQPDVYASTSMSIEAAPQGPAGSPPNELVEPKIETADQATLGGQPAASKGHQKAPEGPRGGDLLSLRTGEEVHLRLPSVLPPESARHDAGIDLGAWCGCPEEDLRPDVLHCAAHAPEYRSVPKRRYDRRRSNPDAAGFFSSREGPAVTGALRP